MSPTVLRLFIIFGIFLTLILLICTGTGIIAYRDYANSKNQSSLQAPWQLPKDEPLPESLRDDLQRAGANPLQIEPDRPHLDFQKWIQSQNGPLEVDYPRFAKAMQDSGVTQSVNWVNNWIIAQALKQSDLGPPELSGSEQILAADWIVANREARLVVSIPTQGFGIGALYAIWLVKHQSTWRIFDWKDLLEPLTNAEYMAAYYEASAQNQDNMYNLLQKIDAIYLSDKANEAKASAIWRAAESAFIQSEYDEFAQFRAFHYIFVLGQIDKLEDIVSKLRNPSNLGREYFKTQIALHNAKVGKLSSEVLFEQAKLFVDAIGWYPGLGMELVSHAETDEEKSYAKSLLIKDLALNESNFPGSFRHFKTSEDASIIWDHLRRFPNVASKLPPLAKFGLSDQALESLSNLASLDDRTHSVSEYLQAVHYTRSNQWDKALPVLEKLFRNDLLDETSKNDLKDFYADALLRSGQLLDRYRASTNGVSVLSIARDKLLQELQPYDSWVRPSVSLVLQLADESPGFLSQPRTQFLRAICDSLDGNWSVCLDRLLPLNADQGVLDDLTKQFLAWRFRELLTESLEHSKRWKEVRETFNNPEFILLAYGSRHCIVHADLEHDRLRIDEWTETLQWYRDQIQTKDNLWTAFFEARLAYEQGMWDQADNWIVKAIEFAKVDDAMKSVYGNSAASEFIPFEYSGELNELRIEMAFRSFRSRDWLKKIAVESTTLTNDLDAENASDSLNDCRYTISNALIQSMNPASRESFLADLAESKLFAKDTVHWLRMQSAKHCWDAELMWKITLERQVSKSEKSDNYDSWEADCIIAAIASRSVGRLREVEIMIGEKWKPEIEFARSLLEPNSNIRPSDTINYQIRHNPLVRSIMIEEKLFQNAESHVGVPTWSDATFFQGVLLLSQSSDHFQEVQLTSGLGPILRGSENTLKLKLDNTDGAVSHWCIHRNDGVILISLYDRQEEPHRQSWLGITGSEYKEYRSALAISVLPFYEMLDPRTLLARTAKELSLSFETACGYYDNQSEGLLIGKEWRNLFDNNDSVAIDPNRPARSHVNVGMEGRNRPFRQSLNPPGIGDERVMDLEWGHFTEFMPVTILKLLSDGQYLVEFKINSKIDPRLTQGWKTRAHAYIFH